MQHRIGDTLNVSLRECAFNELFIDPLRAFDRGAGGDWRLIGLDWDERAGFGAAP